MSQNALTRLPPWSEEGERGVLGCLILSPTEGITICIEAMKAGEDVFFDLRHRTAYRAMLEMYEKREPIDLITLHQRLKERNELEAVGGFAYLDSLPDAVPSAANLSYYAKILVEKYTLRLTIATCTDTISRAYEEQGEPAKLVDEAQAALSKINNNQPRTTLPIKQLVFKSIERFETAFETKGALTGIATGFQDLDAMTRGFQKGDMIVIAARPSVGKSSISMNIADYVAVEDQRPVGVLSLEMSAGSLTDRLLTSRAKVSERDISNGFLAERDFPRLVAAAGKIANAPIYIDDESGINVLQAKAKLRRMVQEYGIRLGIIDYLQLLRATDSRKPRQEQVSEISFELKACAKELNIPIIVIAQLNRELEKEKRKPRLSDLRESGCIEQDSDLIGILYKPHMEEEEERESEAEAVVPVNLLIAKARNGPTGDVYLTFLKRFFRFESRARVSADDVPETTASKPKQQTFEPLSEPPNED